MFTVTSNPWEVIGRMGHMVASIVIDERLAHDLAEIIGGGMHDRAMLRMQGPDGSQWPNNAPATVRKKGFDWPGVETAQMLARENFVTAYTYFDDVFWIEYSGPRNKLDWFEGNNRYGIYRIVWGMDRDIEAAVQARMREFADAKVQGGP